MTAAPTSDGAPPPRRFRWAHFLWLNVLSAALAALAFAFVVEADFLDDTARGVAGWLARHPGWAAWAASAPLSVTALIGVHYGRKGMRRRRAAAARGEPRPRCMFGEDEPRSRYDP
jgi:hypothetical protein